MTDVYAPAVRRWIEVTTLGDLLDRSATERPGAEAVVFPGERVSYAQLAARAEHFARGLLGMGVEAGDRVGYLLPDCVDSVAVMFGAAKLGAIAVPINARFKVYELNQVICHSGMRVLFTAPPSPGAPDLVGLLHETFPSLAKQSAEDLQLAEAPELKQVVVLGGERGDGLLSGEDLAAAADRIDATEVNQRQECVRVRDPAVITYTSGTTAAPKGALISHEALSRVADGVIRTRFFLTPEDRVWTALPMFHIGGISFSITCISAGCTYCHTGVFRPDTALQHLAGERCTVALPGFETIWLPVVNNPGFAGADLSHLRMVLVVGVPERLRDMQARIPHAVLLNCFGQTESSSFLSLSLPDDPLEVRLTTGGHPLPGMQVRIVDPETGDAVPPGTLGEICYRGSNAFDGYFRDPDLTARVFDSGGWFHSGDLGTVDADGRVTFVSRLKDMLKVGGENVAAAEVEGYLLTHPAVNIVQIVGAPDAHYVEVPAAFVELKAGAKATEEEIVGYCVGKIASYRVPRYVRFVDEWPMSGTKIKKHVLREVIAAELEAKGITEAPRVHS